MRNTFSHMEPSLDNLVTDTIGMLCVECGWESEASALLSVTLAKFFGHTCRLVSSMVSEQN